MKNLKTYKIFESKNNPTPTGRVISIEELPNFGVPDSIIELMKSWDIIYKSPFSRSFYSSDDIDWSYKPDGSYRVSDHWNFKKGDNIHCKTDKKVPDNTHYSIGKYDSNSGLYKIILTEHTTKYLKRLQNEVEKEKRLKYLQDPEVIYKKKLFKDSIRNKEVFVELEYNDQKISGILDKYTGPNNSIRIVDKNDNVIFVKGYLEAKKIKNLILRNLKGEKIEDPFKI